MVKPTILICGDSFCADWRIEYPDSQGWPTLLEKHFEIHNVGQCGCGEYKIVKQLSNKNLSNYDMVIVSHTSPYRMHTNFHPVYSNRYKNSLHLNADFIYSDVEAHCKNYPELQPIKKVFENYYDLEQVNFVYKLTVQHIESILAEYAVSVLHMNHIDFSQFYQPFDTMCLKDTWNKHKGLINHYSNKGNEIIANKVLEYFNKH